MISKERVDLLVVGAGPAGLAAATRFAAYRPGRVLVVERERAPGGVARYSTHQGYGLDVHRPMTGPQYAAYRAQAAVRAGVEIRTRTSAIEWSDVRTLVTTSPDGLREVTADAVVIATGCRETPRSARLVPGTRPIGVFTTGSMQQAVHIYGQPIGSRAVVVGAEHVSYAALMSLRHAGVSVAAMLTQHPSHQTYPGFSAAVSHLGRVPLLTRMAVTRLFGSPRLTGIEITSLPDGQTRTISCDAIVFSGEFTPDSELARLGALAIDGGTRGPAVDFGYRTSAPGVFAVGNVLRAAEMAHVAAREGTAAVAKIIEWLTGAGPRSMATEGSVTFHAAGPLQWVFPNRLWCGSPGDSVGRHPIYLRSDHFQELSTITVRQGDRLLWAGSPAGRMWRALAGRAAYSRRRGLIPNRTYRIPGDWLASIRADLGPVTVALDSGGPAD